MDKDNIKWEYVMPTNFYENSDTLSIEDLYQAFKERMYQEMFTSSSVTGTVGVDLSGIDIDDHELK